MKLTKLAPVATVAALALWTSSANAIDDRPHQFEILNFSLTAIQQNLYESHTTGSNYVFTVNKETIGNKELLSFLATAFNTNWPKGAQLAIDWNSRHNDIYVVDKTGTNALFNASKGIDMHHTNVAYFQVDIDDAVYAGKIKEATPGSVSFSIDDSMMSFSLYRHVRGNEAVDTDLEFNGLDQGTSSASWTASTDKASSTDNITVNGDGDLNDTWTVVSGRVIGSGSWKNIPMY